MYSLKNLQLQEVDPFSGKVEDNAKIVTENIAEEILKMKQEPCKDFMLVCGPDLVSTFIQLDLIDEYRIGVVPIILGEGKYEQFRMGVKTKHQSYLAKTITNQKYPGYCR